MGIQKVALKDLSVPVRSFLAQVAKGSAGLLVEDDQGRAKYCVILYQDAPLKKQEAALKRLARLQKKVGKMMDRTGKTEKDLDRLLQEEGS